ncbi:MAG: TonB-dependent receptor [Muribaculaceae bacterium]|nr:TonB-dependent receptor [Muribaculaceae bacterium]
MESNSKSNSSGIIRRIFVTLLLLVAIPAMGFAQKTITGTVSDESGEPLMGVTVLVKGTKQGVSTDLDGKYNIQASADAVLTFTYIGMTPSEVKVAGKTAIDVVLKQDLQNLEEVVVVGYGTQKKVNVTGSIVAVDAKKLEQLPTDNVSNMLAGRLPGLVAVQSSGMPGEGSSLLVRGSSTTSSNGNAPLFIVDGVQRDMIDTLSPDEIANITVLKDAASAAIYGVQGGSGVILITTKRGQKTDKPQITFKASLNLNQNTNFPDFLNATDYMKWHNKARELDGLAPLYTEDIAKQVYAGTNGYGQTNWFDEIFQGKGTTQNYNITINGGNNTVKYFLSGGYTDTQGIVKNVNYTKYFLRSNIDTKITDWMKLSVDLAGYKTETDRPSTEVSEGNSGSSTSVFWQATLAKPIYPVYYDGVYSVPTTMKGNYNPVASLTESGYNKQSNVIFNSSIRLDIDIPGVKGLAAHMLMGYDYNSTKGKVWKLPYELGKYDTATGSVTMVKNSVQQRSVLSENFNSTTKIAVQPSIDYENTFGNHYVRGQVVYDQLQTNYNTFGAGKMNYDLTDIPELNLGSDDQVVAGSVKGTSTKFARQSFVVRANYSYADKYLLNVLMRADASVKFKEQNRWGYFPGVSVGWRLSEESFMAPTRDVLSNLKLRASWGITGNDRISEWLYLRSMGVSKNAYVWGGDVLDAIVTGSVPAYDISWEKTRTTNVGFDAAFLNGALTVEFDYYYKYTWDILQSLSASIPPSLGGNAPSIVNKGKVDNRGFEVTLGYRKDLSKDLSFGVSGNVAYNHNRILQYNDASNIPDYQKKTGNCVGSILGLVSDGLYQDEADLANSPKYKSDAKVGDIKYRDLNGDGKIDLVNDVKIISDGSSPKWNYGINLDARYKWFDIAAFFQGAADFDIALQGYYQSGTQSTTNFTKPFAADGNTPYFLVENSWTPENPNAEFPRLTTRLSINQNAISSDFWLRSGNYIRLKNLQIGATLPKSLFGKSGIQNIRLYVSGTNLFTISKLNKYGLDPEAPSVNNGYYPQQRVYTFGINVTL